MKILLFIISIPFRVIQAILWNIAGLISLVLLLAMTILGSVAAILSSLMVLGINAIVKQLQKKAVRAI